MDKKIVKFLKGFKISDLEIKDIINISPMIDAIDYAEFADNCKLLIKYGYPDVDLDYLILSNPSIFSRSSSDLEEDLKKLSIKYNDIEEALKSNPFLI